MKNWYQIKNKSDDVIDISIHDEIGLWGVAAKDFMQELRNHNAKAINLSIHSPGGSVIDGLAIYNSLLMHPAKIHAKVDGLAGSAASFILMAGDTITMPEDSFIMIHNASGMAWGDADELRDTADVIDKLQDSIVNIYMKRTGMDEEDIRDMMKATTWMNANDALEHGFIDTISDPIKAAAKINNFSKYFKDMPVDNNKSEVSEITNERDFERFLRDEGGVSTGLAKALTSQAKVIFHRDDDDDPSQDFEALNSVLMRIQERLS